MYLLMLWRSQIITYSDGQKIFQRIELAAQTLHNMFSLYSMLHPTSQNPSTQSDRGLTIDRSLVPFYYSIPSPPTRRLPPSRECIQLITRGTRRVLPQIHLPAQPYDQLISIRLPEILIPLFLARLPPRPSQNRVTRQDEFRMVLLLRPLPSKLQRVFEGASFRTILFHGLANHGRFEGQARGSLGAGFHQTDCDGDAEP